MTAGPPERPGHPSTAASDVYKHHGQKERPLALGVKVKFVDERRKGGGGRESHRAVSKKGKTTTFYMTGNLHNWVKFLKLRNDEHSQPETRDAAHAIEEMLLELFPVTMQSLFDGDKS